MFTVEKISKAFAVINWKGEIEIAYKNKKFADQYVAGAISEIFNSAENENIRRNNIAVYLSVRANRLPVEKTQLELF